MKKKKDMILYFLILISIIIILANAYILFYIPDLYDPSILTLSPILAYVGGGLALLNAKRLKLSNTIGKFWFGFGLGLFLFGTGDLIWAFYELILGIETPYPSLGDVSYVLGYVPIIIGVLYLWKFCKLFGKIEYGKKYMWFLILYGGIVIVLMNLIGYLIYIIADYGISSIAAGEYTIEEAILDVTYPLGDFLILIALIPLFPFLKRGLLGSKMFMPLILFLMGTVLMVIFNWSFSYLTFYELYVNSPIDLVYLGYYLVYILAAYLQWTKTFDEKLD